MNCRVTSHSDVEIVTSWPLHYCVVANSDQPPRAQTVFQTLVFELCLWSHQADGLVSHPDQNSFWFNFWFQWRGTNRRRENGIDQITSIPSAIEKPSVTQRLFLMAYRYATTAIFTIKIHDFLRQSCRIISKHYNFAKFVILWQNVAIVGQSCSCAKFSNFRHIVLILCQSCGFSKVDILATRSNNIEFKSWIYTTMLRQNSLVLRQKVLILNAIWNLLSFFFF